MKTNETNFKTQEFDAQEAREAVSKAVEEQEIKLEDTKQVEQELEREELDAEFRAAEQERVEREAENHKENIERMGE